MTYTLIKNLHILCAVISIFAFISRGILALRGSSLLQQRWIKIAPHINDTILLLSAIWLAIMARLSPLHQPWLATKIVLLLVYIALGFMTLRFAKSQVGKLTSFTLALLTYAYIVSIAITKDPLFLL